MLNLFKRTSKIPKTVLEEPVIYPPISAFVYGEPYGRRILAPDFKSPLTKIERHDNYVTMYYDEGEIDIPADKVIIVRRYENGK